MDIKTDFKKLLELFNTHSVEYLIVGGYALAFHGAPRFTGHSTSAAHQPQNRTLSSLSQSQRQVHYTTLSVSLSL